MCFSQAAPQDNSAAIARQSEIDRQARITAGQGKINDAFAGFNPDYFSKFQQAYLDHYNPQIDQQFTDARKNLRYDLARKGVQDSTPGQTQFGRLAQAYADRRTDIAANASSAADSLKGQVEGQKTNLYSLNNTSADPALAAQQAVSAAGSLATPATYSPLADLFSGFATAGAQYLNNKNLALPAGYASKFATPAAYSSSSGRVVT